MGWDPSSTTIVHVDTLSIVNPNSVRLIIDTLSGGYNAAPVLVVVIPAFVDMDTQTDATML